MEEIVFLLGFVLTLVHFFSDRFAKHIERFHSKIISFSAGIFITYIFLNLLPEFFKGTAALGTNAFALLLLGFVVFHSLEKYLYQHIKNKDILMKDLAELHTTGFFFDHFVVGMILFFAFNSENIFVGGLVFLPLLLHTVSSSLSLQHIYEHFNKSTLINIILSASPMLGVLFVFFLNPLSGIYHSIFSFVMGMLFYVVIRDTVPSGRTGNLHYFLIGVIVSAAIIFTVTQLQSTGLVTLNAL